MTRAPDFPDLLSSGAQLVSPERGRIAPPFQAVVRDSADAAAQVRVFAAAGFRNVKLYWRLQERALHGALIEANRLGMNATAHVDEGIVTFDRALALGVRHFEHVHTIALRVLRGSEQDTTAARAAALLGGGPPGTALRRPGGGVQYVHELWHVLGADEPRVLALIERLRATRSTLTPTLHILAQRVGLSTFVTPPSGPFEDVHAFTPAQRVRAASGYRIIARYVAQMDSIGVHLAVGSDTPQPGRAVLSEILSLHAAGIAAWRVLRIATLYTAEAVGRGDEYGAVEAGRRADVLLFDSDPLVDMRAVLGAKTVIKDGVVVNMAALSGAARPSPSQ